MDSDQMWEEEAALANNTYTWKLTWRSSVDVHLNSVMLYQQLVTIYKKQVLCFITNISWDRHLPQDFDLLDIHTGNVLVASSVLYSLYVRIASK